MPPSACTSFGRLTDHGRCNRRQGWHTGAWHEESRGMRHDLIRGSSVSIAIIHARGETAPRRYGRRESPLRSSRGSSAKACERHRQILVATTVARRRRRPCGIRPAYARRSRQTGRCTRGPSASWAYATDQTEVPVPVSRTPSLSNTRATTGNAARTLWVTTQKSSN